MISDDRQVDSPDAEAKPLSLEALDDQALVDMLNLGNTDAFTALYERYRDWSFTLARRFVADDGLAADAVQDTFVYFLKKFPGFRLTAKLTTFLYPVVKHNAQAAARKQRRRAPVVADRDDDASSAAASTTDPALDHAPGDAHDALTRALDDLPDQQREVLLMRIVHDMSVSEVAIALGVPAGTVKSRLFHATESLRKRPELGVFRSTPPTASSSERRRRPR